MPSPPHDEPARLPDDSRRLSGRDGGPIAARWLGRIDYGHALALQQSLAEQRRGNGIPDTILLLEHDPVYTIGRSRDRSSLNDPSFLPHPAVTINRGGQATYHGPGQLVGYLVLDLRRYGADLHRYLRALESALRDALAATGVKAAIRDELTGVWVEDRKIASIGIGVRHWISMHGFALNLLPASLEPFRAITPCGIDGVRMTCLADEAGSASPASVLDGARLVLPRLRASLAGLQRAFAT